MVLERYLPIPEIGQQQLPYLFHINPIFSVKHHSIPIVPDAKEQQK
jgi:hypothetical protein